MLTAGPYLGYIDYSAKHIVWALSYTIQEYNIIYSIYIEIINKFILSQF